MTVSLLSTRCQVYVLPYHWVSERVKVYSCGRRRLVRYCRYLTDIYSRSLSKWYSNMIYYLFKQSYLRMLYLNLSLAKYINATRFLILMTHPLILTKKLSRLSLLTSSWYSSFSYDASQWYIERILPSFLLVQSS